MMLLARKVISLLLLLPFLAGSLGISASKHQCSSSNSSNIRLYPEVGSATAQCCCGESSAPGSNNGDQAVDAKECCKTISLYFKADFQTTHDFSVNVSRDLPDLYLPVIGNPRCAILCELSKITFFTDTGPPLSGYDRVISFHQIKIPAFSSVLS